MPYVAGVLNFSWEFVALVNSKGDWGHIAWFSLDVVIVTFGVWYLRSARQRFTYLASILILIATLFFVFDLENGMLISVFVIDVIMAVWFFD